jgi:hypothetical protein
MENELIIYKNRTNIVSIGLGFDVSQDTITSEIREEIDHTSPLLSTWTVNFTTNGVDGELTLILPESEIEDVQKKYGYMDLKRESSGAFLPVFKEPLKVAFKKVVTS